MLHLTIIRKTDFEQKTLDDKDTCKTFNLHFTKGSFQIEPIRTFLTRRGFLNNSSFSNKVVWKQVQPKENKLSHFPHFQYIQKHILYQPTNINQLY